MNKIKIIPIFVPHIGCPNDCVFCNQRKITGKSHASISREYAENIIEEHLKTIDENTYTEIAFFGGSFTAIDKSLQMELLSVAKYYKDKGIIKRIRCSTRPDAINEKILRLQKNYGMDIIELGIQSLDDEVLILSNRGHTKKHSVDASALIKEYGFILGHQIMPGLPGSSREKDIKTCRASIEMKPDIIRIYPTLVIKDTILLEMYEKGNYEPLSLEEAIDITAHIYSLYTVNNINVIRIGLQNTDSINEGKDVCSGPFHPAFRQLAEEKIYLNSLINNLSKFNLKEKSIIIHADDKIISYLTGQKKSNINILKKTFLLKQISFKNTKSDIIEIYENNEKIVSFERKKVYEDYLNQGELCI